MILLSATKVRLRCNQTELVTSGSQDTYQCQFRFDESWEGLDRTAVFHCGGKTLAVVLDDTNRCQIPWEVLQKSGSRLTAGVYGTNGKTLVLPTIWAEIGIVEEGVSAAELGQEPTADVYSQILAQANSAALSADQALLTANKLAQKMEAGHYNGADGRSAYEIAVAGGYSGTEAEWLESLVGPTGPQGPKGDKGEQGEQGPQGPTGSTIVPDGSITRANLSEELMEELYFPGNGELVDITAELKLSVVINANTQGYSKEYANYLATDYLPCAYGDQYYYTGRQNTNTVAAIFFDENKAYLGEMFSISADTYHTNAPISVPYETAAYIRFCVARIDNYPNYSVKKVAPSGYVSPKGELLNARTDANGTAYTTLSDRLNAMELGNVLYGKKYVACGDSFTWGNFDGYVDADGNTGTASDAYDSDWKMYKTYPYWIAKRNGMTLVNEAIGGTALADNDTREDAFSVRRYKNIPADADYITIKIGINDTNQNNPVGTIDDTDNTTVYGAWNVVLEYLMENHPNAKIGIIVSNGANAEVAEATRKCARKWGIPYLDEDGGYDVPLLHRTYTKTEVCARAKELRLAQYRVSETNTHPNLLSHKLESTFVEAFLRRL